ncbi:MAG: hypothetical protein UZ22_OP11002000993 [Microgenomates bacterium OLB23]|nr:MAG: hypothetical protein UZ22_OP11002000993 [Microgenomates bacterium OLB23]
MLTVFGVSFALSAITISPMFVRIVAVYFLLVFIVIGWPVTDVVGETGMLVGSWSELLGIEFCSFVSLDVIMKYTIPANATINNNMSASLLMKRDYS